VRRWRCLTWPGSRQDTMRHARPAGLSGFRSFGKPGARRLRVVVDAQKFSACRFVPDRDNFTDAQDRRRDASSSRADVHLFFFFAWARRRADVQPGASFFLTGQLGVLPSHQARRCYARRSAPPTAAAVVLGAGPAFVGTRMRDAVARVLHAWSGALRR